MLAEPLHEDVGLAVEDGHEVAEDVVVERRRELLATRTPPLRIADQFHFIIYKIETFRKKTNSENTEIQKLLNTKYKHDSLQCNYTNA